jgi:hypothetical protein
VATGLTINVDYDASVASAPAGFKTTVAAAVSYLESLFSTPITVTINVGYGEVDGSSLGSDLGQSESTGTDVSYSALRSALLARTATTNEVAAAASLPVNDPTGGGFYYVSYAEAEALGLSSGPGGANVVGAIGISSNLPFTYGTTNGAATGTYDVFGVVEHEITEVLGRTEDLGTGGRTYTPLDLFRYSSPGVRDLTPGSGSFSINGTTLLSQFDNSLANGGDAGDWASSVGNDSFDAFSTPGVANPVTSTDLAVMDVIGFTPAGVVTSNPAANVQSVTASPGTGDVTTDVPVTLTVNMTAAVTVSGGTPTLSLNDGGIAIYNAAQSTATALTFDYTAQSGQSTTALAVTGINLNGSTIQATGNTANFSGIQTTFTGLEVNIPLINSLSVNQQLELVYIGYFDRAADGNGFSFWVEQDLQAQHGGQSVPTALTNIANSFAPQAETQALYPFLASAGANLTTPTAQTGLSTFIGDVYENLFDHAAGAAGTAYWLGQISSGAVGLGSAILAIANGATGTDATELQNKVAVALDFTTRTNAAGLDGTGTSSAGFLTVAREVLTGVDGTALNDASVTSAETLTTAYLSVAGTAASSALAGDSNEDWQGAPNPPVNVSTSNIEIDAGAGDNTIQFIAGTSGDTVMLHTGGTDQIGGFNLAGGDALDLSDLFAEAHLNVQDVTPNLSSYLTVVDQGSNASLMFDPLGNGGGSTVAVLQNLGSQVTNLGILTSHNAIVI